MPRIKYSQFEDRLDVEAVEEAIGFEPIETDYNGNHVGHCLFPENHTHGDTTGKFAIHPELRVYNCWVCGGGSILSLIMELYDFDSETAEDWLRPYAVGDERGDTEFVDDFLSLFAKDAEKRGSSMPYFNPRVLENIPWAHEYGEENGLDGRIIEEYEVLYNEKARKPAPRKGKFADDPDYVGPAIIWPHYWNERLVGWQSRWLDEGRPEWVAKWTNTTDFPKDSTLYGWDLIDPERGAVHVVESAKTVLALRNAGLNAVGTFGSSINDPQMRLLRRFQTGVTLCPDSDGAGLTWLIRLSEYLYRYIPLLVCFAPPQEKADLCDVKGDLREWITDFTVEYDPSALT